MAPFYYEMLHTFNSNNKFNMLNYDAWITELEMTFIGHDILAHIKSKTSCPSNSSGAIIWHQDDQSAHATLYKIISSTNIIYAHFKNTTLTQTANAIWIAFKNEFQKDIYVKCFKLKQYLYNPIHNIEKPVLVYIQDIVSAYKALTALDYAPATVNDVDSILMNLHSNFSIVCTFLTT
ncbi:hypothetical protein C0992_006941 [Termitomyces sp. T32_za158]|nr:hypothetical protein C0992_006941 [Termitomyces sp. T32_za158]